MSDSVKPTSTDFELARNAEYNALSTIKMFKEFNGTLDEAIDHFGFRDYVENQIEVNATNASYMRMQSYVIHGKIFGAEV